MNPKTASLKEVIESLPKSSRAVRQYSMLERALAGLQDALNENDGPIDRTTASAVRGLLLSAADQTQSIFR